VIVGVVIGQTCIIVVVVVRGGGLVIGLLCFAGIVFLSELSFSLPISCIGSLGLLSQKLEHLWLAITSGYFILKTIQESVVKMMSEWSITPITARC
jgi:hypothetical protein